MYRIHGSYCMNVDYRSFWMKELRVGSLTALFHMMRKYLRLPLVKSVRQEDHGNGHT